MRETHWPSWRRAGEIAVYVHGGVLKTAGYENRPVSGLQAARMSGLPDVVQLTGEERSEGSPPSQLNLLCLLNSCKEPADREVVQAWMDLVSPAP